MAEAPRVRVTQVLKAVEAGDPRAAEELLPCVYAELRSLARSLMAKAPPGNTLQPTALVHEAYLRIVGDHDPGWNSRGHFFAAAAQAMRRILVEQARRKAAVKHGGDRKRMDAANVDLPIEPPAGDMLALDEALENLSQTRGRAAFFRRPRYRRDGPSSGRLRAHRRAGLALRAGVPLRRARAARALNSGVFA